MLSQEIQNYKMPKSEFLTQFIFRKHLQVIVSRLSCSPSKRLTRNWTVVAIMFFLWRAPPGLSSLRPVKSHCSDSMAHSIRPQLMHFHTSASVCIPCVCRAGILLWIFAVPRLWCIRRSRRSSSAHFPGSCLQLCAFPQTHEPRTRPWAQQMHNLLPHQLEPHESASISAQRFLLGALTEWAKGISFNKYLHVQLDSACTQVELTRSKQPTLPDSWGLVTSHQLDCNFPRLQATNGAQSLTEAGMPVVPALLLGLTEIGSPAHHEKPHNSSPLFLKAMTEPKGLHLA